MDGQTITVGCNWTDEEQPCALWDGEPETLLICNYPQHKPGLLQPYEAYATIS